MIFKETKIFKISDSFPTKEDIEKLKEAADIIKAGGTVCFPTETVYGLGANALDAEAVKEIFVAKGRPQDNPLIIHLDEIENAEKYCLYKENPYINKLIKFFPGPLTAILKKRDVVPCIVTANLDSVGVRIPENPIAHEFLRLCGVPVAAPSANISGKPSPTCADHVIEDLFGKVDAIIYAGNCDVGLESTIVSLVKDPPILLRPGGITYEMLCDALCEVAVSDAVLSEMKPDDKASAPGMKYKHYAPKTPVFLVMGNDKKVIDFLKDKQTGESCAILAFTEDLKYLESKNVFDIGSKSNPDENAKRIFAHLRATDSICGLLNVYVHISDDKSGLRLAVFNRLLKASAYHIITLED
ncbi:MAG: threonylcarbamoyl-AMP synthase [Ruminococcaceae bacterium]|nr:threonylcarbamoyl-AMP synthase [Oscillospiraceae bacterium]